MIIRWVELKNIRSYKEQKISFPSGSMLLCGDVGSGKSTILLAIEFALFGLMRGSVSGSSLLRHGAMEGSVELDIKIGKKRITIKRVLKRGKNGVQQDSGYIIIDKEKKHGTAVELKAWILELLNYPKELLSKSKSLIYRYTVYTPQDEMKRILLEDAEQRLDTLRRVFQIDKYKRIRENTIILNRKIKQRVRELNAQIFDLDEKIKREKERNEELEELKIKIKKIRPQLELNKKKVSEKKIEVEKIERDVKLFNKFDNDFKIENVKLIEKITQDSRNKKELVIVEKEAAQLIEKIKLLEIKDQKELNDLQSSDKQSIKEVVFVKEIEKKLSEVNKIKEEKIILNEKLSVITKRVDELNLEIKKKAELSKDLMIKETKLRELQKEIIVKEEFKNNIILFEKELEILNKRLSESNIKVENSKELKEKVIGLINCPLCKQSVSSEHKDHIKQLENKKILEYTKSTYLLEAKKQEFSKRLKNLKNKLDKVLEKEKIFFEMGVKVKLLKETGNILIEKQKKVALAVKDKTEFMEKINQLNQINLDDKINEINRLKELLNKIKERNNLKIIFEDKKKRVDELIKLQDIIKKEVGKINVKKMELRKKIKCLESVKENYDKERFIFAELVKEERELEVKCAVLNKEVDGIERLRSILKTEIIEKLKTKEGIKKLKELSYWLEDNFMDLMVKMEKQVMLKVYTEFNELFTKWFDILLEDEELNARLDDEFKPVIEQNGYETEIDNLSGGEKTALALAYRLALNKVINDVVESIKTKDIIILDEPTDGFSTEQLDKMRDVLEQLGIKQTIIVSHENKIESFVEKVLKVSKSEHISVVN
ncbi:SMC family ATPase [Candidatus Woesearchaeota archaeon]|nr:SMC family ATPase [Candidatus Woesearchaeota archaeon]